MNENVDREFLDDSAGTFPLTVLISFLVVFTTIVILWWARNRHRSIRRGECLLLCGPANSGKTLLFMRLTMNFVKRTVTSAAINRGILTLSSPASDRPPKKIEVIDIPGNLRIRQREFNVNKSLAKAIVFLINSGAIHEEKKDVADYLYDILRDKAFRQQRLPLLIFCNSQDANSSSSSETVTSIRRLLENELTMKRRTRASSVAVHQGKADTSNDIGRSGKETFEFDDVKDIQIEFVDGSALGVERKPFTGQYDDQEEELDSAGSETDADGSADLNKLYDWIEKIWTK